MGCIAGGLIGTALTACYNAVMWVINLFINLIAKVIWIMGFSVPFFYLLYGLFLFMFGVNVFDFSLYESRLYLIGLCASGICTVIIFVRNCVGKPVRSLFAFKKYLVYKKDGRDYKPEKPKIYRSTTRPDFIVHEYFDRYEIFTDRYGGKNFVRTDYKTAAERRKSTKRQ